MEEKTITLTEEQFKKIAQDKITEEVNEFLKKSDENKGKANSTSMLTLFLTLETTTVVAKIAKELFHKEEKVNNGTIE